jgi:O-antigen/teichoic acid export membrane protein
VSKPPDDLSSTNLRKRIYRGGLQLVVAKGVTQLCSFFRNVIVARIIGVENFGIAATFSLTVSIFEMLGSLSIDRLLVQAKDGNNENFQATGHAVQVVRGLGSGLLIAVLASPVAHLFGVPNAAWAFRCLALLPIMRGLSHLDSQRIQRQLNYGPSVTLDITQQVIPALLAWPIAKWAGDYAAMLWLVLLQGAIATLGSYWVAERPYRWFWDIAYVKRFFGFGWPLIINAIFLFGIYQGDRFLIGTAGRTVRSHVYSMTDLGIYSVATSLTLTPMVAFATICSNLLLPLFSSLQTTPTQFIRRYEQSIQIIGLASGLFVLPVILLGGSIVIAVYGHAYSAAGAFIGWMAAGQAVRMARFAPTMGAMALGDTTNSMYSNMIRFSSLLLTFYVITVGGSLTWIAKSGFFGEVLSLIVCLWKLHQDHGISVKIPAKSTMVLLGAMGLAGTATIYLGSAPIPVILLLAAIIVIMFVAMKMVAFPHLLSTASVWRLLNDARNSQKSKYPSKKSPRSE